MTEPASYTSGILRPQTHSPVYVLSMFDLRNDSDIKVSNVTSGNRPSAKNRIT